MPRPNRNARRQTTDLDVIIDCHRVTALVDTGANYSVISGLFAAKLKKVKTASERPDIRTAEGHLITPDGTCTASVKTESQTYSMSFVVLQQCSRDVILGMDFLDQHGTVIDLISRAIMLSMDNAAPSDCSVAYHAINVTEEQVTVPPLSSVIISVGTKVPTNLQGVIEGDQNLLLNRQMCVARGIAKLHNGEAKVMVMNFCNEYRHLNSGTTVAHLSEFVEVSNAFALTDSHGAATTTAVSMPAFNVNQGLSVV